MAAIPLQELPAYPSTSVRLAQGADWDGVYKSTRLNAETIFQSIAGANRPLVMHLQASTDGGPRSGVDYIVVILDR